jgi:hypothetical protein
MIQTIKQMTKSVPRIPYPNMVPPASIQQIPFEGSSHCEPLPPSGLFRCGHVRRPFLELFRFED